MQKIPYYPQKTPYSKIPAKLCQWRYCIATTRAAIERPKQIIDNYNIHVENSKPATRLLAHSATGREVWAWARYDFANSGYTKVVITALFNAHFVSVVAGDAPWATFAWTAVLALSHALIMISAPLSGPAISASR